MNNWVHYRGDKSSCLFCCCKFVCDLPKTYQCSTLTGKMSTYAIYQASINCTYVVAYRRSAHMSNYICRLMMYYASRIVASKSSRCPNMSSLSIEVNKRNLIYPSPHYKFLLNRLKWNELLRRLIAASCRVISGI